MGTDFILQFGKIDVLRLGLQELSKYTFMNNILFVVLT